MFNLAVVVAILPALGLGAFVLMDTIWVFLLPLYMSLSMLFGPLLVMLFTFILWRRAYMPILHFYDDSIHQSSISKREAWELPDGYIYNPDISNRQVVVIDHSIEKDRNGEIVASEPRPFNPYVWDTPLSLDSAQVFEETRIWEIGELYSDTRGRLIPVSVQWLALGLMGLAFVAFVVAQSIGDASP
jgi:hypothetical protein